MIYLVHSITIIIIILKMSDIINERNRQDRAYIAYNRLRQLLGPANN